MSNIKKNYPFIVLNPQDKIKRTKTDCGLEYQYADSDERFQLSSGFFGILSNMSPTSNKVVFPKLNLDWFTKAPFGPMIVVVRKVFNLDSDGVLALMQECENLKFNNPNLVAWAINRDEPRIIKEYDRHTGNLVPENRLTSTLVTKLIIGRKFNVLEYLIDEHKKRNNGTLKPWIVEALKNRRDEIDCDEYREYIDSFFN